VSVGFCGAFTTFSSFSFQTVSLWERGERARAAVNAVANLLVSLLAFAGAWLLVSH
jgi:CrcB protein